MIISRVRGLGLPVGIIIASGGVLLSGCGSKPASTPATQSTATAQQQQQIQDNPNLSPQAKAAAAAAYSSFASRNKTAGR